MLGDARQENLPTPSPSPVAAADRSGTLPRVSVIIPVYNGEQFLRSCLEALRGSDHPDFEIIVSDDCSSDRSAELARATADRVVSGERRGGAAAARTLGAAAASGEILCFVDADIVVAPDTIRIVARYMGAHPAVAAVTGLLSKTHPHPGFFSQYKNLYMHFILARLPEQVTFLYGSLHAVRKEAYSSHDRSSFGDDTELGQRLSRAGKEVVLLKEVEVVHLKKYTGGSFFKNDFRIPFVWAETFLRHQGLKQLGRGGFAHARNDQILSLLLAPLVTVSAAAGAIFWKILPGTAVLMIAWCLLNLRFLCFLGRQKGAGFAFASWIVTFLDHHVMLSGVIAGFISAMMGRTTDRLYGLKEKRT